MKNKTIYLFIFLVQVLWAQTKPLFPGSEIDIYKIIKNNRQIDSLRYIGSSKSEVEFALGVGDITRDDANDGINVSYSDGLFLNYQDEGWDNHSTLIIQAFGNDTNPYVLSKKFKLGIGRVIPADMFNYEYEIYRKGTGIKLTPDEEATLPQGIVRGYYWNLITTQGVVADSFLSMDVQNGKIIRIYVGF